MVEKKVQRIAFAKEGETPEQAIERVKQEDRKDGEDTSNYEYIFREKDDGSDKSKEVKDEPTIGKEVLTGDGSSPSDMATKDALDLSRKTELPKPVTPISTGENRSPSGTLFDFPSSDVVFRSNMKSYYSISSIPRERAFMFKYAKRFSPFSSMLDMTEKMEQFAAQCINEWSFILHNPESMVLLNKRIVKGMGLDINILDVMNHNDFATYQADFLSREDTDIIESDGQKSVYSKMVSFFGHRFESEMQDGLANILMSNLVEVADFHKFLKHTMDSASAIIKPLDYRLDPKTKKLYVPRTSQAYFRWMDNNVVTRNVVVKYHHELIKNHIAVEIKEYNDELSSMMRDLGVQILEISQVPGLATSMSSAAVSQIIDALILLGTMGRWARIDINVDVTSFNLSTLFGFLIYKLIVPYHYMSSEAVRMIDNYIFVFLMKYDLKDNAATAAMRTLSPVEVARGSTNYLTDAYATNSFRNPTYHQGFLETTDRGDGWANAGMVNSIAHPTGFSRFTPNRDVRMVALTGEMAPEYSYEQFSRFDTFVDFIEASSQVRKSGPGTMLIKQMRPSTQNAVASALRRVTGKSDSWCATVTKINETVMRMTAMATTHAARVEDEEMREYVHVYLPVNAASSAILLVRPESVKPLSVDAHFIISSIQINSTFNELSAAHRYVNEVYSKFNFVWTRSKRAETIMQMVKHPLINHIGDEISGTRLVDMMLRHMPDITDVDLDGSYMYRSMNFAKRLIDENLELFGVVRKFYFVPNSDLHSKPSPVIDGREIYRTRFVFNPASSEREYLVRDYDHYVKLLTDERLADIIQSARRSGKHIEFDIPTVLSENNTLGGDVNPPLSSVEDDVTAGLIRPLEYQWYWYDDHVRKGSNILANVRPPLYVSESDPMYINRVNFDFGDLHHRQTVHKELSLFSTSEFKFIRRFDVADTIA